MKPIRVLSAIITLTLSCSALQAASIVNFDDGTNGLPINTFYASLGVTFSNAKWRTNIDERGGPFDGSSGAFVIDAIFSSVFPKSHTPLIAMFATPLTSVSILATDLGSHGVRIDAYDALTGGNLVGFSQFIGSGNGLGVSREILVEAPNIRRIEFYQPNAGTTDGVVWDNLQLNPTPEPSTAILAICGLLPLIAHRRRESARSLPE